MSTAAWTGLCGPRKQRADREGGARGAVEGAGGGRPACLPGVQSRAGPSPAFPPHQRTSRFQERHCCHGNTCPIIPLAENHLSANLAGTHPFYGANTASRFLASPTTRSPREEVEKRASASGLGLSRRQGASPARGPLINRRRAPPCLPVDGQVGASWRGFQGTGWERTEAVSQHH